MVFLLGSLPVILSQPVSAVLTISAGVSLQDSTHKMMRRKMCFFGMQRMYKF
ncbi:hypothetical protein ACOCEA_03110 [Maribacter sp. CXY002]|uniref:hypothetical protein n=1 Tax=Maribacter luteocoastalis TaxID=3407671 RepID=UPI003B66B739